MDYEDAVSLADSTNTITQRNNNFFEALFNFVKAYICLGVLSVADGISHPGIILGTFWLFYWGFLSLYGANSIILARRKILKDKEEEEQRVLRQDRAISATNEEEERYTFQHEIEEEKGLESERLVSSNNTLDMSIYSEIDTERALYKCKTIKALSDLGRETYGDIGYKISMTILFTQQIFGTIGYIYFMNTYFPSWIILIALIPICMFFNLKLISYVSLLSLIFMASGLWLILGFSFNDYAKTEKQGEVNYFQLTGLPLFYGIWMFMYEGDAVVINVEDSMKKPKDFFKVSFTAMMVISFFGLTISIIPYLAYLDGTSDIIINSLTNNHVREYLKISYVIVVAGTIPIWIYPLSEIIYRSKELDYFRIFERNPNLKFYLGTLVILLFCQLVAEIVPNMSSFLNLAGSVVGVIITIVLPVMFYNKAYENSISYTRLIFNWVLMIFSLFIGVLSFIATIKEELK